MARNEEKSMTTLNKWLTLKRNPNKDFSKGRRPYLTSDVTNLRDADNIRRQLVRDITSKIAEIQNPALGEFRIRELNDEINKLVRQKGAWNRRIQELGGPNHNVHDSVTFDADGAELPGGVGYKYFGAAKNLPGVRELFQSAQEEEERPKKRSRGEISRNLTPDYYGYRDEDDGILVRVELEQERRAIDEAVKAYQLKRKQDEEERKQRGIPTLMEHDDEDDDILVPSIDSSLINVSRVPSSAVEALEYKRRLAQSSSDGTIAYPQAPTVDMTKVYSSITEAALQSQIALPSSTEVKEMILEKKKSDLLKRFLL